MEAAAGSIICLSALRVGDMIDVLFVPHGCYSCSIVLSATPSGVNSTYDVTVMTRTGILRSTWFGLTDRITLLSRGE